MSASPLGSRNETSFPTAAKITVTSVGVDFVVVIWQPHAPPKPGAVEPDVDGSPDGDPDGDPAAAREPVPSVGTLPSPALPPQAVERMQPSTNKKERRVDM